MRRSLFLLVALSFGSASHAAPPPRAAALSRALKQGGFVTFKNVKSGLCIGVKDASTKNRALIQQFECDLSAGAHPNNQHWTPRGGDCIREHCSLGNQKASRKCLGVENGSDDPDAKIRQGWCNSRADQQWKFVANAGGLFIQNSEGLCIGVDQASVDETAQLKQFRCDFGGGHRNNQHWRLCAGPQNTNPANCVE